MSHTYSVCTTFLSGLALCRFRREKWGTYNDASFYPHVHLFVEPHLNAGPLQNTEEEKTLRRRHFGVTENLIRVAHFGIS